MQPRRTRPLLSLAASVLAAGAGARAEAATTARILVLVSQEAPPYAQALDGLRRSLTEARADVQLSVENLEGKPDRGRAAMAQSAGGGARLIVALGGVASEAALQAPGHPPLVAAMVLRTTALGRATNATGVGLEVPVDEQLAWLRRLLPDRRRVAVLFNSAENAERVREAQGFAGRLGLQLEVIEVRTPTEIPEALERAGRSAEVLLGLADSVVFSPESAKGLLLFSFRRRMPIVGVPPNWVRAGALYGLDRDYADVGRQAGEMVVSILAGAEAGQIPPAGPRKVCAVLNLKTARQTGVEFPAEALKGACEVLP